MDELEEMRRQMATMKSQLDTQQIVNKRLMCKVMRNKASWMNLLVNAELIAFPFLYLLIVGLCEVLGISQWYSFTFLVFGSADALLDIRTVRIPGSLFSSSSILSLRKFLIRQKKERFIQTLIMGVLCVAWLSMFLFAIGTSGNPLFLANGLWDAVKTGGLFGGIIGSVIAIIVVIMLYRKMQRTNDRIIADIDDLEKGE